MGNKQILDPLELAKEGNDRMASKTPVRTSPLLTVRPTVAVVPSSAPVPAAVAATPAVQLAKPPAHPPKPQPLPRTAVVLADKTISINGQSVQLRKGKILRESFLVQHGPLLAAAGVELEEK